MEQILEINDTLLLGESAEISYTPPNGKKVIILEFVSEIPFSEGVSSCVCWDGSPIWNKRESGPMPFRKEFTDADGVKEFKLVIDNVAASAPQAVSGRVRLWVED